MGSTVRITKTLRDLTQMIKEMRSKGVIDEYDRGKLNGLLLCFSLLTGRDYEFRDKSEGEE